MFSDIYNYMDISKSGRLNFFRFLCVLLMNFVQICTRSRVGFELWLTEQMSHDRQKLFLLRQEIYSCLFDRIL